MRLSKIFFALAALEIVASHTVFTTLSINEINQNPGACVRMPMTPSNATAPMNDPGSDDMACGYDGKAGVARVCSTPQAAKLDFFLTIYPDNSQPGALDPSHKGPCAVYMKRVESAVKDTAVGDGWFKIWEETYDAGTSQWGTEKLIQRKGIISVILPENLAGGYYLVRTEVLSLHESDKNPPNPQFYVGCAQIFLKSTKNQIPQNTVKIPGYVDMKNPAVLFNIYNPKFPYPPLGPEVYKDGSPSIEAKPVEQQNEGVLPPNAVAENANWWAVGLDSYSTPEGCTNATKICFDQTTQCYNTAPPTGSKGCRSWEDTCNGIRDACNAKNFNGPPQKAKALTSDSKPAPAQAPAEPPKTNPPPNPPPASGSTGLKISPDGSCGNGQTCQGSTFGNCCSHYSFCGSSATYCGDGCQPGFGSCGVNSRRRRGV